MVGSKSTQTRIVGIANNKVHGTSLRLIFEQQGSYEKRAILFDPTIPT